MFQRVEQLYGADNMAILGSKRVGIVGLGSGGGFVALSFGDEWCYQFCFS